MKRCLNLVLLVALLGLTSCTQSPMSVAEDFATSLAKGKVEEAKKYLDSYTTNQNGLYLIKFYNYLNTKSLNLYDFDVEILHKG